MKRKLLMVLTLVLALTITACSNGDDKGALNDGDKTPVENTDTPAADETETPEAEKEDEAEETPEVGEEAETSGDWPEGFIAKAPKFEGKIEVSKKEGPKKHFMKFNDVAKEDAAKYIEEVKAAGFTEDTYEHIAERTMKYKGLDSDGNMVRVFWHFSGDTEVILAKEAN
nr:hypothetical protein [Tissierella sp.]